MAPRLNALPRVNIDYEAPAGVAHDIVSRPMPHPVPYDGPMKTVTLFSGTPDSVPKQPRDLVIRPSGTTVNKLAPRTPLPTTPVKTRVGVFSHLTRGLFGNVE